MQVESFRREVSLVQTHRMDLEEMQTFILRLESQELSTRHRISEELARCELEVQAEGLMITSMIDSFHETSENERQAEISAHKPPTTHRSEMSQATTACDSWINEVIRLTKEVVEQSTKSVAGGNSFCSFTTDRNRLSATLHTDGMS